MNRRIEICVNRYCDMRIILILFLSLHLYKFMKDKFKVSIEKHWYTKQGIRQNLLFQQTFLGRQQHQEQVSNGSVQWRFTKQRRSHQDQNTL